MSKEPTNDIIVPRYDATALKGWAARDSQRANGLRGKYYRPEVEEIYIPPIEFNQIEELDY